MPPNPGRRGSRPIVFHALVMSLACLTALSAAAGPRGPSARRLVAAETPAAGARPGSPAEPPGSGLPAAGLPAAGLPGSGLPGSGPAAGLPAIGLPATGIARLVAPAPRRGWRAPLDGPLRIGRRFDPPSTRYGPGHRGVDLMADAGTAVHAPHDGVVSFAGLIGGRGVVTLVHGSLRTTYEPVDVAVAVGQHVVEGDVIGRLRPGHASCLPVACLHWGLLRATDYLDPLGLLRPPAPPRLLPVGPGGTADGA